MPDAAFIAALRDGFPDDTMQQWARDAVEKSCGCLTDADETTGSVYRGGNAVLGAARPASEVADRGGNKFTNPVCAAPTADRNVVSQNYDVGLHADNLTHGSVHSAEQADPISEHG